MSRGEARRGAQLQASDQMRAGSKKAAAQGTKGVGWRARAPHRCCAAAAAAPRQQAGGRGASRVYSGRFRVANQPTTDIPRKATIVATTLRNTDITLRKEIPLAY